MTRILWGKSISFHTVTSTLTDCFLFFSFSMRMKQQRRRKIKKLWWICCMCSPSLKTQTLDPWLKCHKLTTTLCHGNVPLVSFQGPRGFFYLFCKNFSSLIHGYARQNTQLNFSCKSKVMRQSILKN